MKLPYSLVVPASVLKALFGLLILCISTLVYAQDTIKVSNNFSVVPFFGMDRLTPNNNREVRMPESISSIRSLQPITPFKGVYSNYPQWHFSMFGGIATETKLAEGYKLRFALIGEDRAGSYGVLKRNNMVVFPQVSVDLKDTMQWRQHKVAVRLLIGDMPNFRYRNGLAIYNVDAQGADVALTYRHLQLGFTSITDLSQHVGIGIGEVYGYQVGLTKMRFNENYTWSAGGAIDLLLSGLEATRPNLPHLYVNVDHRDKKFGFYGELGYRFKPRTGPWGILLPVSTVSEKIAGVFGFYTERLKSQKWRYRQRVELRYYGLVYNERRTSTGNKYTSTNSFLGDYLYPLRNAYRPFDQWAVYTEYAGQNVAAFSWYSQNKWRLSKKFQLMVNLETIGLLTTDDSPFLYYFYESGLVFEPAQGVEALVYLSNKVMNSDVHYQTFYQSKRPLFSFGFRKRLTGFI